ncbi:MAG: response regulator transcription factor [Actinomycetota bacterium]|nr:response regulator transcription factor [Actinomycetota bacterium]
MARTLIIEDDPETKRMAAAALGGAGFRVRVSTSLLDAVPWIEAGWAELVILNVRLGGEDCRPFVDWLLTRRTVRIVLMSAVADGFARASYLELGADECVRVPISPPELMARIRSVLRTPRAETAEDGRALFCCGPVTLDSEARRVRIRGTWVVLTGREFALVDFLVRHPRRSFHRIELLERVWGYTIGDLSTVTVHVRRVREKLELDPGSPELIVTVWGKGYRFEPGDVLAPKR